MPTALLALLLITAPPGAPVDLSLVNDYSPRRSTWMGFERLDFQCDGRACFIVLPDEPAPGKPWIWRTEFFGHEPQADLALIRRGFHAAYINVQNMYGGPPAMKHMDAFHQLLTEKFGLAKKVVLEGFSRGGLFAFNWAARRPECVAAIYGDAPVCDFKSWPGGKGRGKGSTGDWQRCLAVYGLSEAEALEYRMNPVDNLAPLAKAKIPVLCVCGEADEVVPIDENSRLVEQRYRALGGEMVILSKPFCNHHPHSLKEPTPIVDFILRHTPEVKPLVTRPAATPYGYDYHVVRGGLENCRQQFQGTGEGRVVFLGGSITAGGAWRQMVCDELVRRFPKTRFEFLNAGISSLGSTPHAFRLVRDVLEKGPVDLLFLEAAVNDETNGQTPEEALRAMEGIVRHVRHVHPMVDIVFLHFVDPEKMTVIRAGKTPPIIASHERVAAYYELPSIDLAQEVTERIHKGEFTWEKDFRDLHPSPFGHKIYFQSIGRLLDAAWSGPPAGAASRDKLPSPLDRANYDRGQLVDLKAAKLEQGWTLVEHWKPANKAGTRAGFVDVPALVAEQPAATLRLKFRGTAVGLFVAAGPDAGQVEYAIDGGKTQTRNLYTPWSDRLHLPWAQVFSAGLTDAPHEMVVRVSERADPQSKGHAVRIIHFLVNGE